MAADVLTVLIIVSLGAFAGTAAGLLIGFLAGKQKKDWAEMDRNEKLINLALVIACSAICIASLAWYVFR